MTAAANDMAQTNALDQVFTFGAFRLLPYQRVLQRDGATVPIGSRALDLLITLVRGAGHVISNRDLLAAAWPGAVVEENNLRVQMGALRKLLGDWDKGKPHVANIPLRGYSFVAPVKAEHSNSVVLVPTVPVQLPRRVSQLLPARLGQVIGRDETVQTLASVLPTRRLVTLVGPGGIGKTTVALAVAERLAKVCEDGAVFVDLSSLTDGARVMGALAGAVGMSVLSDDQASDVIRWMADKQMLVVLDNCEHVIDEAATLAETLAQRAPSIMILATSREPLRVANEWLHRLPPLAVPPVSDDMTMKEASSFAAIELFVERAGHSVENLHFTDDDAVVLAQICRHLDGLPLAIELVAARIDLFGLHGLAAQLNDRLQLLGQGRRTALPRHQTLRAALKWSYDLLSDQEKCVLRSLSLFRGQFDADDASAVCGDHSFQAAVTLSGLAAKSLLAFDSGTETPYRLLETTRGYGLEKLIEAGELDTASTRHAMWCLRQIDGAEAQLKILGAARWRDRYARRLDDVRAALGWLWRVGSNEIGQQLVADAIPVWFHFGLLRECLTELDRALASMPDGAGQVALETKLLVGYAHCSMILLGPNDAADAKLDRARSIVMAIEADAALRLSVSWTTFIRQIIYADYSAALQESDYFGRAAGELKDRDATFVYHRMMALSLHFLGRQAQARTHIEHAVQPEAMNSVGLLNGSPQQSDHRTVSLSHQARILWLQGDCARALRIAGEAYRLALDTDHALPVAYALAYACCPVALWAGEIELAERYVGLLDACTHRHGLSFWHGWPRLYAQAINVRAGRLPAESVDITGLNQGHLDMLATLDVGVVQADGSKRVSDGLSQWCAPEILRNEALRASLRIDQPPVNVEALLLKAIDMSNAQQAPGWALRSALTLARILQARGSAHEARTRLLDATQAFDRREVTADLQAARALLTELSHRRGLAGAGAPDKRQNALG